MTTRSDIVSVSDLRIGEVQKSFPTVNNSVFVEQSLNELYLFMEECPTTWLDTARWVKETITFSGMIIVDSCDDPVDNSVNSDSEARPLQVRDVVRVTGPDTMSELAREAGVAGVRVSPYSFMLVAGSRHGWDVETCRELTGFETRVFNLLSNAMWEARNIGEIKYTTRNGK